MTLSGKYERLDIPRIGKEGGIFILRTHDKRPELVTEMNRLLAALREGQIAGAPLKIPATEGYQKALRLVSLLWENYKRRIIQAEELQKLALSQKLRGTWS